MHNSHRCTCQWLSQGEEHLPNASIKTDRPKQELYEPLWDDLFDRLRGKHIHINSIWIADVAHQGASGALNEEKLGNDRTSIKEALAVHD